MQQKSDRAPELMEKAAGGGCSGGDFRGRIAAVHLDGGPAQHIYILECVAI
jgi:hypothetical protein